ncbi:histidinol-phosphatase [Liquorilactobacillus sucicola DSM 21376 = JCM 15457]|uniref:Histidinol-phosphatase n=1 Tax=Liquorilactobacillus sucicola DSM 21376 = JCM 15457 TaxID=1423806 RepID=A0A0R2DQZ6_9LACO|nr:histidinol-phosphatase HisJ [Liquorilactobacillus sucicola]KRN06414.1 histidinol-phosphatase [Liquorilactobacillus sucicola DSM 21376 = JCM 15457]
MKIDGHTHTELCPHGSGEPVEKMIQKAIMAGFDHYCITEHAPLPRGFDKKYRGSEEGLTTAALAWSDLEDYFSLTEKLQKKYAKDIQISVGFEVDYLPGFEREIKAFLDEYGARTQQNILSVHFMQGKENGLWCLDYTTADFVDGFSSLLQKPQQLYQMYLKLIYQSVTADLGQYRPQRIGHMSLIKKYQDYFKLPEFFDEANLNLIKKILDIIAAQKRELDFNTAGMYKPYCNDFYPGKQITELAVQRGIPFVFGSDAHGIDEVGRGYHLKNILAKP